MELTAKELSLILGIKPEQDLENITVVIQNSKSKEQLTQMNFNTLFEKLYKLPVNMTKINKELEEKD